MVSVDCVMHASKIIFQTENNILNTTTLNPTWKTSLAAFRKGQFWDQFFFLLYINDIKNCTTSKLVSFADDTTIYYSSPNQNELFQKVNEELIKLYDWLCANKLSLNISKTIYSIYGPSVCTIENRESTPMLNNIPIVRLCNSDLKTP